MKKPRTEDTLVVYPDLRFEEVPLGSKEFRREADLFVAHFQLDPACTYRFQTSGEHPDRAPGVLAAIAARKDLQVVVVLSHGWDKGIQCGFSNSSAPRLAQALAANGREDLVVVLYCCSAGSGEAPKELHAPGGDGGFADVLRDALCAAGLVHCRVYAHIVKGHTTRNPYVRVFEGKGSPEGGRGGEWLVEPTSPEWKTWDLRMHAPDSMLRFDMPFLTREELAARISGGG